MAKKTVSKKTKKVEKPKKPSLFHQLSEFLKNRQTQTILGVLTE